MTGSRAATSRWALTVGLGVASLLAIAPGRASAQTGLDPTNLALGKFAWQSSNYADGIYGGDVAAIAALGLSLARRHPHPPAAAATDEAGVSPRRIRHDYPSLPDLPPMAPERAGASSTPPAPPATAAAAPAEPPPPAQVIQVGDGKPTPPPRPASAWAMAYRDAVCACHTRRCVGDLQGAMIRNLEGAVQGDEADDAKYAEATHAAITCYFALPEGS